MSPRKQIALGCGLTAVIIFVGSALVIHRVVLGLSNISVQIRDLTPVISAGINEALKNGDKEQRLAVLASLEQAGPNAVAFCDDIEPLLNDPDAEIRAAASAAYMAIDPTSFQHAIGPPPPGLPRPSSTVAK